MAAHRPNLTARRRDGSVLPVEISLSPLQSEDGLIIVATIGDITERLRAAEERRDLEGQLRQSQKMEAIGTLAGGIAHDFNNILTAIIGNAQMASQEADPDSTVAESLAEISRAGNRAADLVRQIMAFSRQQKQSRDTIALRTVTEEVVRLLRAALPASIDLAVSSDPATPHVVADPSQVHQVLMNLCTNAAQAMAAGGGRIDIRLEPASLGLDAARVHPDLAPGDYARLSVADTGSGMDQATLERIFEPFFTTKAPGAGTGLGLAVVHGIVKGHGGAITVRSRPDEGSTFDVYLPAAERSAPGAMAEEPPIPRGAGQEILCVDDEPALVRLNERFLGRLGYRVTGFTRPRQALAALREDPMRFDLLLTDLSMPEMSGTELAREALAIQPGLPIAITTGLVTPDLLDNAEALGVREFLTKPTSLQDLAAALRRIFPLPEGDAG
jgi:signal transduction histidine kinase